MRVNDRLSSAFVMICIFLLSTGVPASTAGSKPLESNAAVFATINFVPNIETVGVAVSGSGLPSKAELFYRRTGETVWRPGHPLMRIDDGRLIGSLFNLSPATSYDVRVSDGTSEIVGSVGTQPDQLSFVPTTVLHVNDDAPAGGNGSTAAPFKTIQEAVNRAVPGTQVLVQDGLYREAVTFPRSGTSGNWIQVKAAGNAAILDSSDRLSGNIWTPDPSKSNVYYKRVDNFVAYLARDGIRYYQYDDRNGLMQARGHGGVTINEGWFYETSTLRLYIRSQDNPSTHSWQIPRLNHAFDISARDWIWLEGFEIRFYGTTTNGCGVCTTNASHIVIRRNKIHNMQLGIFINWNGTAEQGNDTRIEQNEVYDPLVDRWPWTAVKGSYMENTGIIIRGHVGAIVRDNNVHNYFNGIYTGSSGALENPELAFDADIYRNYIHHVSDDALEPEGACINQRFRNNTIDRSFIGISLAPITQGPTWVLRSTFANFFGRGIKLANNSDGIVLIYHNTGWTAASNMNGMDLLTPVHNIVMRNNIFQSTGYSFAGSATGSKGNDWNYNNWYTTKGSAGPHFKWENVNYNTVAALCSARGLECNGYENLPGFTNPAGGDFTLLPSSPNIDRGVIIPGINDGFAGNAPDAGAFESIYGLPPTPTPQPAGPFVSTGVNPTSLSIGGTALVNVSLNNVPADGFKSAEFTCTYDASLIEKSNIVAGTLFGTDPVIVIPDPQSGRFIVAIAGSAGNRAAASGPAFTFNVRGLQAGQSQIQCTARVSKGDNVPIDLPSTGAILTILSVEPSLTSFVAPTLTPTLSPNGTLSGQVIASKPVTISLLDANNVIVAAVVANPDGTFSLTALAGNYTLVASASGFLGRQGPLTIIAGNIIALPASRLPAGDVDGNHVIDRFDAMTLGMSYAYSTPASADLNNDGIINFLDLELLAGNYGKVGPSNWE